MQVKCAQVTKEDSIMLIVNQEKLNQKLQGVDFEPNASVFCGASGNPPNSL